MPTIPDRDPWFEAKGAEFAGWAEAQGYDESETYDFDQLREAFTEGMEALRALVVSTGSVPTTFTFPGGVQVTVPPMAEDPRAATEWEVIGQDSFDDEDYPLGDPIGTRAVFPAYELALGRARKRLHELETSQPKASAGDLQDRVFVIHPGGRRERVL